LFSGGYETLKILIADDDKTVTKVLERLMVRWGHEVLVASDGRQAQLLLEQNQEIDIAILDWNMPHKTGVDIIREQRTLPLGQQHPFYGIILTSNAEKQCMVQGFDAGADDFITKPFDVEVLKVRLRAGERIIEAQKSLFKRNAKLDEEVKSRTEELSKTLAIAERASEMKSHFLANMSHEIRTPLSGIVSYIELLLYSELTEEQEHDLRTIQSCAHSLRTIINDVLDFSKIEAGRMVIEKAPFNVKSATEEIVELLKIVAQEKEVEVILTYQCGNTKYVGDKIRYYQMQLSSVLIKEAFRY
jgi:signal transduction histidine kinase